MKALILFLCLFFLTTQDAVGSKANKKLTDFISSTVERVGTAVSTASKPEGENAELSPGFYFRRFLLLIQAKVGFDIELGKIELVPEIELVWQRSAPQV